MAAVPAMRLLRRTHFGNPVLRQVARRLSADEIVSDEIQRLIADMFYTVEHKQYGIGLAAPQIGKSLALSVIAIKATPSRPDLTDEQLVIINPEIVETYGRRLAMWEGCISFGSGKNFPYAQAMRYARVRVRYLDQQAKVHERTVDGMLAHVMQHEIDHLEGVLFVDRVTDPKSFIMISEFKKRYVKTIRAAE